MVDTLTLAAFALGFIALGIGIGLSIYHHWIAWFMGRRSPEDMGEQAAKAIEILKARAVRGRRPIFGTQNGRHLADPGNRPQEPREGPSEGGDPNGASVPDMKALQAVEALESRRLGPS